MSGCLERKKGRGEREGEEREKVCITITFFLVTRSVGPRHRQEAKTKLKVTDILFLNLNKIRTEQTLTTTKWEKWNKPNHKLGARWTRNMDDKGKGTQSMKKKSI